MYNGYIVSVLAQIIGIHVWWMQTSLNGMRWISFADLDSESQTKTRRIDDLSMPRDVVEECKLHGILIPPTIKCRI